MYMQLYHIRLNQLLSELRSNSPVRATGRVSRGHSEEMLAIKRHRGTKGKLSQVRIEILFILNAL